MKRVLILFMFLGVLCSGAWADWSIAFTNTTHTETGRQMSAIKLGSETISVNGAGNVYQDLTSTGTFHITQGDEVKPSIVWNGSWMHCYVYVDTNKSGDSLNEFTTDELASSAPMPSQERNVNLQDPDEYSKFNIPATPGTYRMRYVVVWNSTNPKGTSQLISNGGYIIDVNLEVASRFAKTYTVTSNVAGGGVVYEGQNYTSSLGLTEDKLITANDLQTISVEGCTNPVITVDESTLTIHVEYLILQLKITELNQMSSGDYYYLQHKLRSGYQLRSNVTADSEGNVTNELNSDYWGPASTSARDVRGDAQTDIDNKRYFSDATHSSDATHDGATGTNYSIHLTDKLDKFYCERLWQIKDNKLYNPQSGLYLGNYAGNYIYQLATTGYSVQFTKADNDNFYITTNSNHLHINAQLFSPTSWTANADSEKFYVYKVNALPLTIGSTGWSTVCYPVSVTIPEGVTAYIVSETTGQYMNLQPVTGSVVAKTPLIIEGEAGTHYFNIASSGTDYSDSNKLQGTTVRRVGFGEHSYYALAADSEAKEGVSFKWNASSVTACPANKAFIPVSSFASSPAYYFNFDEGKVTSIETTTLLPNADTLYNLQGQPVSKPTRGIYVKANCKKVFILK